MQSKLESGCGTPSVAAVYGTELSCSHGHQHTEGQLLQALRLQEKLQRVSRNDLEEGQGKKLNTVTS